ncbi:MAG: ribonuclease P protein subunit [Candidatus Diapherotrites archaeon]|nr:ribonuclease P protein subunit [Candidatus Diapherotrites archaeon]
MLRALASNELIGLDARVVKSSDPSLEGLSGKLVDETMNTLELETEGRVRKLDKKSVTLIIRFPDGEYEVPGREILQRPEERLKKLWTKVK